jgi:hypothetical protein
MQINGDDWASAVDGGPAQERAPLIGTRRKYLEVVCCEKCGGIKVARRDNGRDTAFERWECGYCGHGWREPAGMTCIKCYGLT